MLAERPQDEKYKVGGGSLFISVYSPLVPMKHYGSIMEIHGGKRCMEGETRNSGDHWAVIPMTSPCLVLFSFPPPHGYKSPVPAHCLELALDSCKQWPGAWWECKAMENGRLLGGHWTVTTFFNQSPQDWFVPGILRDGQVSQEHGSSLQENSINRFLLSTSHRPRVPFSLFTVTSPQYLSKFVSVGGERGTDGRQNEHLLSSSHSVKMWVCWWVG